MNLELCRFQSKHYAEYASWFVDPELNRRLGPMDRDWLEAVMGEPEEAGITWAVFRGAELVAVVETVFDPDRQLPAGITAVAVKPDLRRQGIGRSALQKVLALDESKGMVEHIAYIAADNQAARRYAVKIGFAPAAAPNEHGYVEFRYPVRPVR